MLPPIKVLQCLVCQKDVRVNANYPITSVTCQDCHRRKNDKNV